MSNHPQLFDALPVAVEQALRTSIQRFGVLVPVVRDQHGALIDGRHRSRIADELGVTYSVDTVQVRDADEAAEIQRTLNADRRHLNEDQRRAAVVDLRREGHSERAIAGALGVSKTTVHNDIEDARLVNADQSVEPKRVARQGGGSYPSRRPTVVRGRHERDAQRAQRALAKLADDAPGGTLDTREASRAARDRAAERRRAEPIEPTPGGPDIRRGDFRQVLDDIPDQSVDLVLTDPPYGEAAVPLYGHLAAFAARKLKPGGSLIAYTGQATLIQVGVAMAGHLRYWWTFSLDHAHGGQQFPGKWVMVEWKPVLWFVKDHRAGRTYVADRVRGTRPDKVAHEWAQGIDEVFYLIEQLTDPGALVVDPFAGSGAFGKAALHLGRRFIGADLDPGSHKGRVVA